MKKIALIVQSKDADSTVDKLGALGVVHVEHQKTPKGDNLLALQEDIALINNALSILSESELAREYTPAPDRPIREWRLIARRLVDYHKRLDQLEEYSRTLLNRIREWERWGDFDPERISSLSEKNIFVRFYQIPVKELDKLPADIIVKKISSFGSIVNCAIISREKKQIPFKELLPPKMGLEKMRQRLAADKRAIEMLKEEIAKNISYRSSLLGVRNILNNQLEFQEAIQGMAEAGSLRYLSGYIPYDYLDSLRKVAKSQNWGIFVSDPSDEDRVPTLIRNPRWVSIINPLFKVIEVVPGYRELDISLWFLIFFSIFYGMLIGDAGYGVVSCIFIWFIQKRFGRRLKDKSIFILLYMLSLCAVIWGILTGRFFGQEWLPQFVRPLMPALRDDKNVQVLCFFLGALHLSLAHSWRLIIKFPSLCALSEMGWIFILWTAFFLAKLLILGDRFPNFISYFLISGIVLVILFSSPKKNILKGIGLGLGNLLLNLVNNFTDTVSYIRLFAVGLATVAVADAFNQMAVEIGFNNIVSGVLAVLILLVGHALNIMLGPMAVLVHGVRLNVLEFCNHLDIKWSGFSYKPLKQEVP